MDLYKRELERKFVLKGTNYTTAHQFLLSVAREIAPPQVSFDRYWKSPRVDFIRLRENSMELTVKVSDKGTVTDRIEENVRVFYEDMEAAARFSTLVFGPATLELQKKFSVYRTTVSPAPGTAFEAILCLYQVLGDPKERIFFEVEAESLAVVDYMLGKLEGSLQLETENRSLYQIFMETFNP